MDRPKILLIDDESEFREMMGKLLIRRGFDIVTVPDGTQGIKAAEQLGFEVAVVDVKMPGLDGIATLAQLKRIRPDLEVIILTGHLLKSTEQEGLRLGAFAYLTKPCTVGDLVQTITSALAARAGRCAKGHAGD
jgi:CheY-like chemotaxis protein